MAQNGSPQGTPSSAPAEDVINATLQPDQEPVRVEPPKIKNYDPDEQRDRARARITYWLLALLTALIVLAFYYVRRLTPPPTFEQLKTLIEILLGPVVALVSAATGFYFGAQSASKGKDS